MTTIHERAGMEAQTEDTFAEALGNFTVDHIKNRIDRVKRIIDRGIFANCPAPAIKDCWEALIEVQEIFAAGICILVARKGKHPRSFQDWLWSLLDKAPLAAALFFLGIVLLRINDLKIADIF